MLVARGRRGRRRRIGVGPWSKGARRQARRRLRHGTGFTARPWRRSRRPTRRRSSRSTTPSTSRRRRTSRPRRSPRRRARRLAGAVISGGDHFEAVGKPEEGEKLIANTGEVHGFKKARGDSRQTAAVVMPYDGKISLLTDGDGVASSSRTWATPSTSCRRPTTAQHKDFAPENYADPTMSTCCCARLHGRRRRTEEGPDVHEPRRGQDGRVRFLDSDTGNAMNMPNPVAIRGQSASSPRSCDGPAGPGPSPRGGIDRVRGGVDSSGPDRRSRPVPPCCATAVGGDGATRSSATWPTWCRAGAPDDPRIGGRCLTGHGRRDRAVVDPQSAGGPGIISVGAGFAVAAGMTAGLSGSFVRARASHGRRRRGCAHRVRRVVHQRIADPDPRRRRRVGGLHRHDAAGAAAHAVLDVRQWTVGSLSEDNRRCGARRGRTRPQHGHSRFRAVDGPVGHGRRRRGGLGASRAIRAAMLPAVVVLASAATAAVGPVACGVRRTALIRPLTGPSLPAAGGHAAAGAP